MAIKIIKKPSHLFRAECPQCYALLEYNFHDISSDAIQCPCCSFWFSHTAYGTPVKENEEEK